MRGIQSERASLVLLLGMFGAFLAPHSLNGQIAVYSHAADEALSRQNYDLAISDYKKVLKASPSFAPAWNNLGTAWFAKNEYAKASEAFLQAVRYQPKNDDYQFNAGIALMRSDQCDAAKPHLERSTISVKYKARAEYLEGVCAFVHEQWQVAEKEIGNAESNGFQTGEVYYMLTIASRKANNPEGAERAYKLLCKNFPDSPLRHELLGEALDRAGQDEAAQSEIASAIASRPKEPGLHLQLGVLELKWQDLPGAKASFEKELAIDTHSYMAMRYLGDIAERSGQPDAALEWYQHALKENREFSDGHYALGRLLADRGRYVDALRELEASFPAMDQDVSAHYWMARVLQKLGRNREANDQMAKVREIHDAARLQDLQKLGQIQP
jgi:tetratricopeptide (TPR) repeat protein